MRQRLTAMRVGTVSVETASPPPPTSTAAAPRVSFQAFELVSEDQMQSSIAKPPPPPKAEMSGPKAGVTMDLIVRGACGLRAGVPGLSENIQVRSIVGRFLEHSRAYHFENGGSPELYMGSADLMERNLDRRVETLVLVRDAGIARHMRDVVFDAYLRDTARAYALADRTYERIEPAAGVPRFNAQEFLIQWYANDHDGGPELPAEAKEWHG